MVAKTAPVQSARLAPIQVDMYPVYGRIATVLVAVRVFEILQINGPNAGMYGAATVQLGCGISRVAAPAQDLIQFV